MNKFLRCLYFYDDNGKKRHKPSRLYGVWQAMRQRIYRKTHPLYPSYGGRGICIYPAWDDYANFRAWAVVTGYSKGLTIDRVDNDGNYEPKNCQWLDRSEHALKTHKDNPRKGVAHPMARYTEDDIREIRRLRNEDGLTFLAIAEMYGTEPSHINQIHKRKCWKSVK